MNSSHGMKSALQDDWLPKDTPMYAPKTQLKTQKRPHTASPGGIFWYLIQYITNFATVEIERWCFFVTLSANVIKANENEPFIEPLNYY